MPLNIPKISAPTVGEASRLNPMRAPKAPKLTPFKATTPKTGGTNSGLGAGPYSGNVNYDTFMVNDPYNPSKINSLAQAGYNQDTANANKLAAMGYLSPDQINAQAANRGTEAQGIAQALQQQLAGIQTATVAQGNVGGSVLAGQNAATAAAGNPVASATGAANVGVTGAGGAQAVLGSQTAAGGNYLGSLQAAALSSGATNQQKALDQGATDVQANTANIQKTLASLLAGEPTVSAREATMLGANQTADAANKQTAYGIYSGLVQQAEYQASLGEKKQSLASTLAANKVLQGMRDNTSTANAALGAKTSRANNTATTTTSRQNALTAAAAKKAATFRSTMTPAQRLSLSKALQTIDRGAGTKVPTKTVTGYSVTLSPAKLASGNTDPTQATPVTIPVSAADYASGAYKKVVATQYPGRSVTGALPKTTAGTTTKNVPSSWTTYNRRVGVVKSQFPGITQAQAVQYLAQAGYRQPGK